MKIHPFAAMFPMLPKGRLEELAADIAEHGLAHPLIIDSDGVLLDGRNRLAACEIAKVEPRYETWTGKNPEEYILSLNVHRRHLPGTVNAMAYALVYPEPARLKRKSEKTPSLIKIRDTDKSMARAVIKEFGADSNTVKLVMRGGSLLEAHQSALDSIKRREEQAASLAKLQESIKKLEAEDFSDEDFDLDDLPPIKPETADPVVNARVKELQKKYDALREQHKERLEKEQKERALEKQKEEIRAKEAELLAKLQELQAELSEIPEDPPGLKTEILETVEAPPTRFGSDILNQMKRQDREITFIVHLNDELKKFVDGPFESKGMHVRMHQQAMMSGAIRAMQSLRKLANHFKAQLEQTQVKPVIKQVK